MWTHKLMAINDCPETASETYLRKKSGICLFYGQKIPEKILQISHAF